MFRNNIRFYGEVLLAPRPDPNLEDYPLSVSPYCLFGTFAANLYIWRPYAPSAILGCVVLRLQGPALYGEWRK